MLDLTAVPKPMVMSPKPASAYIVVWITTASEAEAEQIAASLLDAKLAACVSVIPVTSHYTWQGQVHRDQEYQLMIKTQQHCFADLEARVRSQHSYEVPEIIALPLIAGSSPYLSWIAEQTRPELAPGP